MRRAAAESRGWFILGTGGAANAVGVSCVSHFRGLNTNSPLSMSQTEARWGGCRWESAHATHSARRAEAQEFHKPRTCGAAVRLQSARWRRRSGTPWCRASCLRALRSSAMPALLGPRKSQGFEILLAPGIRSGSQVLGDGYVLPSPAKRDDCVERLSARARKLADHGSPRKRRADFRPGHAPRTRGAHRRRPAGPIRWSSARAVAPTALARR